MKKLPIKYRNIFGIKWRYNTLVFNWLLVMTAVALPFPDYSLVSKFLILSGLYWLFFYNSPSDKISKLKSNFRNFLSISILFWLPLAGLLNSDNYKDAVSDLGLKLPFLLLPLIVFSVPHKIPLKVLHKYFAITTVMVSLSAVIQALYFKYNLGIDYTFYHEFSFFTRKHTTYFGLFLSLSVLYFVGSLFDSRKNIWLNSMALLILFVTLYINGNRMSLLSVITGIIILTVYKVPFRYRILTVSGFLILFLFFIRTDFFKSRVKPLFGETNEQNELVLRKKLWEAVWQTAKHNNIWIGAGTESHRDYLYRKYKEAGYEIAFLKKYNAHNQFLEIFLDFGITGVILFIMAILYHLWLILKSGNLYLLAVYLSILVFLITESLLERQNGVIVWALFVSLILQNIDKKTSGLET